MGDNAEPAEARRDRGSISGGELSSDKTCKIGDGFERWIRGVSQPNFLVTTISDQTLAYVSGCHIKYLKILTTPLKAEVVAIFHVEVDGIGILEGNPSISTYAIAETTRKPRILIYKYDSESCTESLAAELKGCAEFEYRAIRFTKKDLLLVLVGVPEFTVSVWWWEQEQEILVVNSLENEVTSDLIISNAFENYWIEWSKNYITFYELQAFTENNVIRTEISLPPNQAHSFESDPRRGVSSGIDIISVTWANNGDFFALDSNRNIYKLHFAEKTLIKVGPIRYEPKSNITHLFPYESHLAAMTSGGIFLIKQNELHILVVDFNGINLKGQIELSGGTSRLLPFCVGSRVLTNSFYAINDTTRRLDIVVEGRLRSSLAVTDFVNSNIQHVTFIEPEADYVATVSDAGSIIIWEARTGNLFSRWKLPFQALTVQSHPLLPYVVVGTPAGTVIFLDIRDLEAPKVLYRGYLNDRGVIDRAAFCARGKLLVTGDSHTGKLYLQYGLPTLEFMYLDNADLPGRIWHINVPSQYKDLRLQILTKNPEDEVPSFLNNYKLENDQLELVASQAFDAPMTTLCFSPFKRLMYSYSCDGMGVGLIPYTEDLQAGSLKEPDLQFNFDFQLDINRILVISDMFFTFGDDGYVFLNQAPAPKHPETVTRHKIQTHLYGQGGIFNGIVSLNGTQVIAIGRDRTLVHITLEKKPSKPDWEALGLGADMKEVIAAQLKIIDNVQVEKNPVVQPDEMTLGRKNEQEVEDFNARKYLQETQILENGIEEIRESIRGLLIENYERPEEDKLDMDEFELDSDEEDIQNDEFQKDKQIAEAVATSIIDERGEWVRQMKDLVWESFQVKGSRINGFEFSREISNYPLMPIFTESQKAYNETIQSRLFERKVDALEEEINRIGAAASVNVLQIVLGMGKDQPMSVESFGTGVEKLDPQVAADALDRALEAEGSDEEEGETAAEDGSAPPSPSAGDGNLFKTPVQVATQEQLKSESRITNDSGVKDVIVAYSATNNNDEASESVQAFDVPEVYLEEEELVPTKKKKKTVVRKTDSGEIETVEVDDSGTSGDSADEEEEFDVLKMAVSADVDEMEEDEEDQRSFQMSLYSGSCLHEFIKPNPMLHDQLELSSRHHIRNQMVIIETEIRRLKEYFNAEYEEIRSVKEAEMKVIADRNSRLREITDYFGINMDILDPAWNIREEPANVFIVQDSEIPFERYYTEEERAEIERKRLEDEARRLAQQDDFYERALVVMMDGVLETRREDVLRRDIPKPMFMALKEEWEWNQEEFKQAEEYKKKVADLEIARAEFKKELEQELRTIIRQNADSKQLIDQRIRELWILKIRVEMCIRMEEIKLSRMVKQIMRRHQLDADEERLSNMLKKLQDSMKSSQSLASQLLTRVESCTKRYEFVVDRERLLERTFRRDLGEVGHFFDHFMRLYKKRPRFNLKNEKISDVTNLMIQALNSQNLRAFAEEHGDLGTKISTALMELDDPIQNPMGCPRSTWDRFTILRKDKILCEYETRAIGAELLELKQALAECKSREDEVSMAIATVLASLSHQRDIKMANIHNFEFQMVLNQGQVELTDAATRSDFYNAVLLKKKFVEICNHFITKYGSVKLRAMNRGKVQHRQIKQLEWRYKCAAMSKRDLQEKFHDINTIKATKDILGFIKQGWNFKKMQEARLQKIRELQILSESFHKKFINYQKSLLKGTEGQEKSLDNKNKKGEKLIFEQNLYVNEARLMCNSDTADDKDNHVHRRMKTIMQTGRMMRRIARNAEEIVLLENELDRQYRRTYPVL